MLLHRHLLSSCLVLVWLCPSSALCPAQCTCRQSERGKRKVSCLAGGMSDPIPTADMDPGMEVLEIAAPDDNPNSLALAGVFQKFRLLEEVHVVRSGILQIGMHAFWGVPGLRVLNLTRNNISALYDHNFRGLVNLAELYLDDNAIGRLPSGVFRHLTELRILTLRNNRIGELVPRLFLKLGKLQVLKLSGNQLEELNPEVFKDILELRWLECRSCALRRINTQIYHLLPYLAHLDLGDNMMQFISDDEFVDLRRLRTLRLDGNQFPVVLERTFVNQGQLVSLCLARNRLAKITNAAFLNLSSLQELDIGYNKLDKMEGVAMVPVAESLRRLVVSGNHFPLSVVKILLQVAHSVVEVGLADLAIAKIPPGFFPDRLRHLNLSGNNLTDLKPEVLPAQLADLDLSRNKLSGLGEALAARLDPLRVTLRSNPWVCSESRVGAAFRRANRSRTFGGLVCASPAPLAGRNLSSLRPEDLREVDGHLGGSFFARNLAVLLGAGSLAAFVALSLALTLVCRRRSRKAGARKGKRTEEREMLENPAGLFDKEISFKFSLDLTERKVSVSTIDEMKKDTRLQTMPNGTGI